MNLKNLTIMIFAIALIIFAGALADRASAAVGVPKILSYQGRLLSSSGNLLGGSGTTYCFRFSLWDASSGGAQIWPAATASIMSATVANGVFDIGIGDTSAGGDALTYDFQDSDTVYLNVQVATLVDPVCTGVNEVFETLSPRERVVASGYAINSYSVDGFTAGTNASGTMIPVLASDTLTLAGVNPEINATGTNTLTLQGGAGTGAIQFFSASNFISNAGALRVASTVTGSMLQTTATSSQLLFAGVGATGTITWTPTASSTLTIPNFGTATDTIALLNLAQTLNNKTLGNVTLSSTTAVLGMSIIQNAAGTGLLLQQNATGTALAITNIPSTAQSSSTVSITNGVNVSGAALLVSNFGSGNAIQINDATSTVLFSINTSGTAQFKAVADSTGTFIVSNASGTENLLTVDPLDNYVKVGSNKAAGSVPALLRLDEKADAGDPTGFPGAMYYNSSTGEFRCDQGAIWYNCIPTNIQWQQSYLSNRWGDWTPVGITATTMSSTNLVAPVVNGTAAASAQAEDYYIQWTSAATNGASAGVTSTFAQTEPRYTPRAATRIRTDTTITSRRIWFALNSATLAGSNGTGTLATVYFGIVYSTAASSTDWLCGSGDGTTGSTIDTGVPVAASTYYDFILDATTSGQLTCSISTNGGNYVSVTKTNNVPTSTTALGITDTATALSATAVIHRISYVYLGSL